MLPATSLRRGSKDRSSVALFCMVMAVAVLGDRGRAASSTPFYDAPQSLPGTILAADFDNGGAGVAYGDSTSGNSGGGYRQTDVDLEPSADGRFDVGWIDAGEWLNYTVVVTSAGSYTVSLRVASPAGGGALHLGFNGPSGVWTPVTIPATGGWQAWTTVTVPVTLGGGQQQMTLLFDTPGFNVESIRVSETTASGPAPFRGTPVSLPGTVQAVDFDEGGSHVSYSDSTPGNSGGEYRQTDVDIERSAPGGYNIGWVAPGEWLNYTVNVTAAGSYVLALSVASPNGGAMHVGLNGPSNVWQALSVPATGGWQNWTTISTTVTLGAGTQQLTVYADTDGFNFASVSVAGSGVMTALPRLSHVYVIVLENKESSSIVGRPDAAYMNALVSQYGLATAYTGITHPSLPNYMALTGGDTFFADNCIGCRVDAPNIADSLEQGGLTWRAYMEDMPEACGQTDTALYTARHNPFVHYTNIVTNASRCIAHVVPFNTFQSDLSSGRTANFVWITPNLCNDMHDCDIATGDRWLASIVPQIMSAPDFANSVLFITFDEGTSTIGGGGLTPLIVVSPRGLHAASSQPANHYDLLRTMADVLGVTPVGKALQGRPLSEFFVN